MSSPGVWAVVVAAGRGDRFGGPKQYEDLGGRRVIDWAVAAARSACDGVVLVVAPDLAAAAGAESGTTEAAADAVVAGGTTRSDSVRAGLAVVPEAAGIVVVHDAARPLAAGVLFERVIDAVRGGADGAVPALPVTDTVKRIDDDARVVETLDRTRLVAVQTPQAFRAAALRRAHATADDATDDAALVEATGGTVVVVAGDPANVKVTRAEDLERLRRTVP